MDPPEKNLARTRIRAPIPKKAATHMVPDAETVHEPRWLMSQPTPYIPASVLAEASGLHLPGPLLALDPRQLQTHKVLKTSLPWGTCPTQVGHVYMYTHLIGSEVHLPNGYLSTMLEALVYLPPPPAPSKQAKKNMRPRNEACS